MLPGVYWEQVPDFRVAVKCKVWLWWFLDASGVLHVSLASKILGGEEYQTEILLVWGKYLDVSHQKNKMQQIPESSVIATAMQTLSTHEIF